MSAEWAGQKIDETCCWVIDISSVDCVTLCKAIAYRLFSDRRKRSCQVLGLRSEDYFCSNQFYGIVSDVQPFMSENLHYFVYPCHKIKTVCLFLKTNNKRRWSKVKAVSWGPKSFL